MPPITTGTRRVEAAASRIVVIRGCRVLVDSDLALLYGVTAKQLNQQVRRNIHRFPSDFAFRLTQCARRELVTTCDRFERLKHASTAPMAFTERGAIMAASVLRFARAVSVSVFVVRAFVRLRAAGLGNAELARRIADFERQVTGRLAGHDELIGDIIEALKRLARPPAPPPRRRIGFVTNDCGPAAPGVGSPGARRTRRAGAAR